MEIQLPPKDHARLAEMAQKSGRAESDIVRELLGSYLDGIDEVRTLLENRRREIESGAVTPLTPEELWTNLERRKQSFRQQRA